MTEYPEAHIVPTAMKIVLPQEVTRQIETSLAEMGLTIDDVDISIADQASEPNPHALTSLVWALVLRAKRAEPPRLFSKGENSFALIPNPTQMHAIRQETANRGWIGSRVEVSGYRELDPSIPVLLFTLKEDAE